MLLKNSIEFLEITILRRENPQAEDFWDANWLKAEIKIEVEGFKAHYATNLRVDDFQRFYEQMNDLKKGISQEAKFFTMEDGLSLSCKLQSTGNLMCEGRANNETGNILEFKLLLEGIFIERIINQLDTILKIYPLIGAN